MTPGSDSELIAINEIARLKKRVQELEMKLMAVTTAAPAAYLWRPRGDTAWKEGTMFPPTKTDLLRHEFKPVYDIPNVLLNSFDIWQHVKTQGLYYRIGEFRWEETNTPSVLYRSVEHDTNWGRATDVFMDGRFVKLTNSDPITKE